MNEELQSTNEELQSMNEELTSSREELQSLNEELLTVNMEHQKKIAELSESNDDMRNLLQITNIAMLFLDDDLRVRRFTTPIRPIVNLQAGDVERPITDLAVNLKEGGFSDDLRGVLRTLQVREREVQTKEGRWFKMQIRPYRTAENRIEGVIVTFIDISQSRDLESSIRRARACAEEVMAAVHEPLLVLDDNHRVVSANRSFYTTFGITREEAEGNLIYALQDRQWDIPRLHELLEEILPKQGEIEDFLVEHDFPGVGHRVMRFNARALPPDAGPDRILLAVGGSIDRPT